MLFRSIAEDSQKEEFDIQMPRVGEYDKDMLLAFEKEVLGIYISGHPLETDQALWQKFITNTTNDFMLDEETGTAKADGQYNAVIGGLIAGKTIKYTKNDKVMAFLNLEDMVGNVEVVVFPGEYERYGTLLSEDAKVFVKGRIALEEDKDGKLICEQIVPFAEAAQIKEGPLFRNRYDRGGYGGGRGSGNNIAGSSRTEIGQKAQYVSQGDNGAPRKVPEGIWIQFSNAEEYQARKEELFAAIADSDGKDEVVIYLRNTKAYKSLPPDCRVAADEKLQQKLSGIFGKENVKCRFLH